VRIGIGYDIHRLVEERKLVLGGVEIPYFKGLLGHSDGDAVIHAISDALLGALALGDIGQHFPDSDAAYKGISSVEILKKAAALISHNKYTVKNVDVSVIAEEPKIAPFKEAMTETIARVLGIEKNAVNIKATTNEGVGSMGRGEAIAAYAVALLAKTG
jgi:2-C-methyl-D-erythritol 2,4-cyclodiphosphate synthase